MAFYFRGPCPSGRLMLGGKEYAVAENGLITPELSQEDAEAVAQNRSFVEDKSVHIEKPAQKAEPKRSAKKKSPRKK